MFVALQILIPKVVSLEILFFPVGKFLERAVILFSAPRMSMKLRESLLNEWMNEMLNKWQKKGTNDCEKKQ